LQVEVTTRGAARPVLVSRFLAVDRRAPAPDVLTPPTPRPGLGFTTTAAPDLISGLRRFGLAPLPAVLAGQPRRPAVFGADTVGLYGAGLAQLVVLSAPGRLGRSIFDAAQKYGQRTTFPEGELAVISTSLVSVAVARSRARRQTFVVAGLVEPAVAQAAGAELAGLRP
jgi:hypothetical protein